MNFELLWVLYDEEAKEKFNKIKIIFILVEKKIWFMNGKMFFFLYVQYTHILFIGIGKMMKRYKFDDKNFIFE